jgi:hypothetical protein
MKYDSTAMNKREFMEDKGGRNHGIVYAMSWHSIGQN